MHRLVLLVLLFAVCAHAVIPGVSIDPNNPAGAATPADVLALGAKWVRVEFIDASTQSLSRLGFYQSVVGNFSRHGINTLVILDYMTLQTVPWGSPASAWAAYATAFAARCGAVAAGLRAVTTATPAYEIWNEEDLQQTHVPPAAYANLLQLASEAIKASDARAKVVIGGLASGDPSYVTQVMAAGGGVLHADEVGIHPYGQRPFPSWPSTTWGFGYMGTLFQSYVNVMPKGMPLFVTEFGTTDMSSQGRFPYMLFTGIDAMSGIPISAVVWYCWSDGQTGGFGLVTASGQPKLDYASYVNYTAKHK
jgi:hypothetical protein